MGISSPQSINNQSNGISINLMKIQSINKWEYPPYKQSINGNIHPINNQSNGISTQ